MNSSKGRFAPQKYKGDIKEIPLYTIIDYISFTCILYIENGENTGALFFENGDITGARLNNDFDINKSKDILNLTTGTFSYHRWKNEFEIETKQLRDVLYFIEIANINADISFIFKNKLIYIYCSDGAIVGINPHQKEIKTFIDDILKETKGNIKIKSNRGQTGDMKEYFSEIIDSDKKELNLKAENKKTSNINRIKSSGNKSNNIKECFINTDIIEQSFKNLKDDLEDTFLSGNIFTAKMGKPIYSFNSKTNQSVLFAKLHKVINDLFSNSSLGNINEYYLLDMQDNYLVFILTFTEHHFGLVFDKSKIQLGYLFNIIKPILTNDYYNALK